MDDQGWSQKTPGLNHRFFVCFYQNDPNLKISFLSLRIRGSGKQEFLCGKSRYEVGEVSLKLDNLSNNYNLEFDFIACWTCENCHVNMNSKFQFFEAWHKPISGKLIHFFEISISGAWVRPIFGRPIHILDNMIESSYWLFSNLVQNFPTLTKISTISILKNWKTMVEGTDVNLES